jgi:hypothetical protein
VAGKYIPQLVETLRASEDNVVCLKAAGYVCNFRAAFCAVIF